jgi:hypothetical protein
MNVNERDGQKRCLIPQNMARLVLRVDKRIDGYGERRVSWCP